MPIYLYRNPKTDEIVEVLQTINEDHVFSKDGVKYERVFTVPNASIDTQIDPRSQKDFVLKTRDKKETLGSMWDRSKEASEKRIQKDGVDPVQENFYKKYAQKRKGKAHPELTFKKETHTL